MDAVLSERRGEEIGNWLFALFLVELVFGQPPRPRDEPARRAQLSDLGVRQRHGFAPIHAAAQHGDMELLELLLSAGADPSAATEDGATPADMAGAEGHVDAAHRLREVAGA